MFPRLPSFFSSAPPHVSESIDYRQSGVWSRASVSIPLDYFGGGAPPYLSAILWGGALSFSDIFGAPWPSAPSSKLTARVRKNIPSMMRLLLHRVTIHDSGKEGLLAAFPCWQYYILLWVADCGWIERRERQWKWSQGRKRCIFLGFVACLLILSIAE